MQQRKPPPHKGFRVFQTLYQSAGWEGAGIGGITDLVHGRADPGPGIAGTRTIEASGESLIESVCGGDEAIRRISAHFARVVRAQPFAPPSDRLGRCRRGTPCATPVRHKRACAL
ncbi:protein of unknown function [Pararobbsia alpina]